MINRSTDGVMKGKSLTSLDSLSLSILPLQTQGLRRAKLVKNSRLEGMVALFDHERGGVGLVEPGAIRGIFNLPSARHPDVELVMRLSELPSYDPFNLRISLREHGIDVEQSDALKLSTDQIKELTQYMGVFTRPLVRRIYGEVGAHVAEFTDMFDIFKQADTGTIRKNITQFTADLGIELSEFPEFLRNYGDVFLSLSYYQYHLEFIKPVLEDFSCCVKLILNSTQFVADPTILTSCQRVENDLKRMATDVALVLNFFRTRTEGMWDQISKTEFEEVRNLITGCQSGIGAAMCALWVKLNAWNARFPTTSRATGLSSRVQFIMSELSVGLDRIPVVKYQDGTIVIRAA